MNYISCWSLNSHAKRHPFIFFWAKTMQFSFMPYLALGIAGIAIISSTANPLMAHNHIPVRALLNPTSTSLILTTTTNPGTPLQPSTITANVPIASPTKTCERSWFLQSLKNYLSPIYIFSETDVKRHVRSIWWNTYWYDHTFHSIGQHGDRIK